MPNSLDEQPKQQQFSILNNGKHISSVFADKVTEVTNESPNYTIVRFYNKGTIIAVLCLDSEGVSYYCPDAGVFSLLYPGRDYNSHHNSHSLKSTVIYG